MKLHRQTGSVSLIFMLGIFCVAIGYGVYFFLGGSSSHSDENQQEIFDSYKKSVQNAMQNPHTIDISVKRNPNPFRCLYEQNANCSGAGGDFLLFEDDQKPALSQIVYGTGLNKNGFGCKNFPSQECSYRIETVWVPICQGNYCENTSSFHVKVKLVYDQNLPGTSPQTWEMEQLYSPKIELSQAVICARGGGVWAEVECLSQEQAAQRNIASDASMQQSNENLQSEVGSATQKSKFTKEEETGEEAVAICENQIELQGQFWPMDFISSNRAQVRMTAMNGCPAEDIYVFQCIPKNPNQVQGEGQWVQVEASLAPPCDVYGNPIGAGNRN